MTERTAMTREEQIERGAFERPIGAAGELCEAALEVLKTSPAGSLRHTKALARLALALADELAQPVAPVGRRVSERFIERLECPECGVPADTSLFPMAVRYHAPGCSALHKPVSVRYYRERA